MGLELMRLAEVCERTGLSCRTVRGLEASRVVVPERAVGPHRLYSPSDLARLLLVKRMTALGFSHVEVLDLLGVVDQLERSASSGGDAPDDLVGRAAEWLAVVRERRRSLRAKSADAEDLATVLTVQLRRQGVTERFSEDALVPPAPTLTGAKA
jgi:MerR family copper efflux transcriptional regulator